MKSLISMTVSLLLFTMPLSAEVLDVWTGAGPNACHGQCTFEGSEHMLSEERLAQLRAVQEEQPEPQLIYVQDGSILDVVTYFEDGVQKTYNTYTVVAVENPEPALGWDMGDWQWVMLDDCSNPSAVTNNTVSTVGILKEAPRNGSVSTITSIAAGYPTGTQAFPTKIPENQRDTFVPIFDEDTYDYLTPDEYEPTIAAVPLPHSFWMLLIGYILGFCSMATIRKMAGHN